MGSFCMIGIQVRRPVFNGFFGERLGDQPGQLYEILATVCPLGPGGSWDGLGVLRGVQLGPWAWVRWPVTPTGTGAGSSAPPPYRRLAAGG
jgi:hypothetical protein